MKTLLSIVVVCALLPSVAAAQEADSTRPTDHEVIVLGGLAYPYLPAEFPDYWKRGWNAGIGYGLSFAPGRLGYGAVNATVEYSRYPFDDAGYRSTLLKRYPGTENRDIRQIIQNGTFLHRGTTKLVAVMLNFRGSFSSSKRSIAPYFLAGVGYTHLSSDSIAFLQTDQLSVGEERQSAFAWTFGVGVEVPVRDAITAFVQGKSMLGVFDRTRQYFPVSAGVRVGL